ncbi:hypothetical protein [Pusillimonas sp. ANT_WB101]|uniref:hypothetical protein n=1 Tax=Pusillimonas sp. ANT_WB101 TaxID=2597356 RepID=UPI0011EC1CFD|nr:hypothetical protein [Pusillimonas sp. ANT_WB101]KAA0889958.1 hypothetical protein FQ179_16525 [Pusillimonas sp. ANT_WB101]
MKWPLILLIFLAGAATPVHAQSGLHFARDAPITRFKQADIELMTKTLNRALDNGPDGVAQTWENPSAGNSGSITPGKDPQGRNDCRKARVENRHKLTQNVTDAVFCKVDGKWKALSK